MNIIYQKVTENLIFNPYIFCIFCTHIIIVTTTIQESKIMKYMYNLSIIVEKHFKVDEFKNKLYDDWWVTVYNTFLHAAVNIS